MEMKSLTINGQRFSIRDGDAVSYKPQNLTEEQQEQARKNIGVSQEIDYSVYFDIDYDGIVSLKPKYRADGAENAELPEVLVIPDVINNIAVSALSENMFGNNLRIKSLTIPSHISVIPKKFANKAIYLEEIKGTENIEVICQAAFQFCSLKKAEFPKLREFNGPAQFNGCAFLSIADIGNTVNTIPTGCFSQCDMLSLVRGGESVTTIGEKAFQQTRYLKNLPFIENVKSMANAAFLMSRVNFDWWNFKATSECSFTGSDNTPAHYNPTKWWEGCAYTACEHRLGSTFHQENPEWASENLPGSADTYGQGCMEICAAHIYSAFVGVAFNSPKEFIEMLGNKDSSLLVPTGNKTEGAFYTWEDIKKWYETFGLECEICTYNSANLQKMYTALADGALVQTVCLPAHAVVIYGIASNGEVLVLDSDGFNCALNDYTARTFQIPIGHLTNSGGMFMIVRKPKEE